MRWRIRKEFCEYLLNNDAMNQAEAEIIALADNTSAEDIPGQKIAGNLLLRSRMWSRALQEFQTLLSHDPRDPDVFAGVATAAFELGQYSKAEECLDRLPRETLSAPHLARMHEVSKAIVSLNPFAPGLSTDQKAKRTATAIAIAQARVSACERQSDDAPLGNHATSGLESALAQSNQNASDWTERNLRRHPDRVEKAMSSVFEMEDAAAERCGEPQGADYALWLIGRGRGGNSR